jgi:hypothetical protein
MKSLCNLLGTVDSLKLDGWYSISDRSVGNILFPPPRARQLSGLLSYLHNRQVGRIFLGNERGQSMKKPVTSK